MGDSSTFAAITCYYNPLDYKTRRKNFEVFRAGLERQGVKLHVAEMAYPGQVFRLDNAMQFRATDVCWQKERLLNLAIERLPDAVEKVAWLDCDLLFAEDDWAGQVSAVLNTSPIAQVFSQVVRLPQGHKEYKGQGSLLDGAHVLGNDVRKLGAARLNRSSALGYGWAARRELLSKHGLYDRCIIGGGDSAMWLAMHGLHRRPPGLCGFFTRVPHPVDKMSSSLCRHFRSWADGFHADVHGNVGHVAGTIYHLWHGFQKNRRYHQRWQAIADFDPVRDVYIDDQGCLAWATPKHAMHAAVGSYFQERREDG